MYTALRKRLHLFAQFACLASAAGAAPPCFDPIESAHHPLFGALAMRSDREFVDGEVAFGLTTSATFDDLNADGKIDCVAASTTYVAVMLGRGGGLFSEPTVYDTGSRELAVAIGDVNGDGIQDVVAANDLGNSIGLLAGIGDGTFAPPRVYAVGEMPKSIVIGDFDEDRWLDVATVNVVSSDVSILLNAGDGTLLPQQRIAVQGVTLPSNPNVNFPTPGPFLAAGDLNGDGHIDLAVPAGLRAHLLLGDGTGAFREAENHARSPRASVYNIKLADLNADGALDIAAAINTAGVSRMVVWLNDGAGGFPVADEYDSSWKGIGPLYANTGLTIGDLNHDAMPDIALTSEGFEGIPIHTNLGDGSFSEPEIHWAIRGSWFVEARDINDDGFEDLAIVSNNATATMRIHLNDRAGHILGPQPEPPEASLLQAAVGHAVREMRLAGGGVALAVGIDNPPRRDYRMEILEALPDGHFERLERITLAPDGQSDIRDIARYDGEGWSHLIAADTIEFGGWTDPGRLWLVRQGEDGSFTPEIIHECTDSYPINMDVADLDDDGHDDVLVTLQNLWDDDSPTVPRRLLVLRGADGPSFAPAADITLADIPWYSAFSDVDTGDLDADGVKDVVCVVSARDEPGILIVLRHEGGFTFREIVRTPVPPNAWNVKVEDFDHDGRDEIAVMHARIIMDNGIVAPYLSTYRLNDYGHLEAIQQMVSEFVGAGYELEAADFDRDGNLDLVMGGGTGRVLIHLGNGDGTFQEAVNYDALHSPFAIAVADFNTDGRPDIASTSISTEAVSVQLNVSCYTPCPADLTGSNDPDDPTFGVPDLDADSDDFFFFLDAFSRGDATICDLDDDADCDADDYFLYLTRFATPCAP